MRNEAYCLYAQVPRMPRNTAAGDFLGDAIKDMCSGVMQYA